MDLGPHIDAIRGDVESLAGVDESARAALERAQRPLEASLQVRLLDALGEVGLELSGQLPGGHVEVRVAGRDANLVYVGEQAQAEPAGPDEEGGTARLTLRMPDALKSRVETAAEAEGISTNAWLVRAAGRALTRPGESKTRKTGNRITGYARS